MIDLSLTQMTKLSLPGIAGTVLFPVPEGIRHSPQEMRHATSRIRRPDIINWLLSTLQILQKLCHPLH